MVGGDVRLDRTVVRVVLMRRVRCVVVVVEEDEKVAKCTWSAPSSELSSGVSGSEWCSEAGLARS
jgi:hypothetical protein